MRWRTRERRSEIGFRHSIVRTRFGQGEPRRRERRRSRGRTHRHRSGRGGWPIVGTDSLATPRNSGRRVSNRFGGSTTFRSRALPTDRKLMIRTAAAYVRDSRLRENPKSAFPTSWKGGSEDSSSLILGAIPEDAFISGRPRIIPAYTLHSGTGRVLPPPWKANPPDGGGIQSRKEPSYIYMPLLTGTTVCTTLGEPSGGDGGSIPAVNDAGVLILPRCNIARRWRSHGRGLAFSARFVVARGWRTGQSIRRPT